MQSRTPAILLAALAAIAARGSAPDFRAPPLGSAGLATNNIMVWGGYTLGGGQNVYAGHIWLDLDAPTHGLTVCSWVAIHDADGADENGVYGGIGDTTLKPRALNALPMLYYSPNIERSAPDLLGGAWGWGGDPVTVSGTNSVDYGFPPAPLTPLEYVESTGAQWVDIGADVPTNGSLSFDLTLTSVPAGAGIWGQQVSGTRVLVFFRSMSTGFFDGGTYGTTTFSTMPSVSARDLRFGGSGSNVVPRHLFTTTTASGGPRTTRVRARLRSFSLASDDGVLVRDFVPVLDANGVAGLWDRVSGRVFYSATSTPLVAGPERAPTDLKRCHSLGWNGGVSGTNAFPRGVYTVAWTNLSSTLTLTVGGTDMTLEAPSGNRNVQPGEADGFILSGAGSGCIGISRMKIHPFYSTGRGWAGDSADVSTAVDYLDQRLVGTNWCFVAHRVLLDASVHSNHLAIIQQNGTSYTTGIEAEMPPDGSTALGTNGWYQLLYSTFGEMRCTYVYEWDRRVFDRWLSDEDLLAIYEDGLRIRTAHGYDPCVYTNAVYQPDP